MWPEFRRDHFIDAIVDYQSRERRFGLTSSQVSGEAGTSGTDAE
jgi:undecaprenyl diphosphate synthase